MNKGEYKQRFALTLLAAGIVFAFMLTTVLLTAAAGYFCVRTGIVNVSDVSFAPTRIILLMSVISLAVGALITALAGKFPLKPVNRIISQMNRLASGDFKARLEFKGLLGKHPTVREICDSFNKMAKELDNTEMLRSDFINNFSHEFKTPIVSIAGFAKLLRRGNLTEEQRMEYIGIIEEESLRLSSMATNVLNMTKVENQSILTDVTEFNLSEQLRGSILTLERKWEKKHIEFNLLFGEHTICGNRDLLKQVWINLIDNGIKFSHEYGTVEIRVTEKEDTYDISFRNHGTEIPEEQISKIYNKFYQADESHASEGNGIGLAVVKGVVELHGGTVSAACENGTTEFTVTLPKSR